MALLWDILVAAILLSQLFFCGTFSGHYLCGTIMGHHGGGHYLYNTFHYGAFW